VFVSSTRNNVTFAFKLVDLASRQTTWVARSQLDFVARHNPDDALTGLRFATSVVSHLRDDGVLPGCPAAAAGWPEVDVPCSESCTYLRSGANRGDAP
jgi:hypothetical protein